MAAIVLSLREALYTPSARISGPSLLAQAQTQTSIALGRALAPAVQQEQQFFASGVSIFLAVANALQAGSDALTEALTAVVPDKAALGVRSAFFLETATSTLQGTTRVNAGRALVANARHSAERGESVLALIVGGGESDTDARVEGLASARASGLRQVELRVTLRREDTNRDALLKIADAINSANAGVTATVQQSGVDPLSFVRLRVEANEPGTANAFALSDRVGNAVVYTGANEVQTRASDQQTDVAPRLVPVEVEPFHGLNAESRSEALALARQSMAAYNEALDESASSLFRPQVREGLLRAGQDAAAPLAAAGMSVVESGRLRLNEGQLLASLTNPTTAADTIDALRSLGERLSARARAVTQQPVSGLLQQISSTAAAQSAALVAEVGGSTMAAPLSSFLRSYQAAQQQLDPLSLLGVRRGALVINRAV